MPSLQFRGRKGLLGIARLTDPDVDDLAPIVQNIHRHCHPTDFQR
jgi:hypothetical protein